jgi:hypothetical protein
MSLSYWLAAEAHLAEALAGRGDWIDRNRTTIETSQRQLQKQLGEVLVTGSPAGALVTINGKSAGTLPLAPVRVVAGQVRVEASAPGYVSRGETLVVTGETRERVTWHLARQGSPAQVPTAVGLAPGTPTAVGLGQMRASREPPPERRTWSARKMSGLILAGVGVASIAAGVLMLRSASSECGAPPGAVCDRGARSKAPGWSLIGVGAVAEIVGGVMLLSGGDEPARSALVLSIRGYL